MTPSELKRKVYWQMSLEDIRLKIMLYTAREQTLISQQFETIAKVVSAAFSGGEKDNEAPPIQLQNKEHAVAALQKVFG